jgi:hypothetical protein
MRLTSEIFADMNLFDWSFFMLVNHFFWLFLVAYLSAIGGSLLILFLGPYAAHLL